MKELKRIDFVKGELRTDEHVYKIYDSICIERYLKFEQIQLEVAFGITFQEMFKNISELVNQLNKTNFVESAVIAHNILKGIHNGLEQRKHPILKMCALFLIREDEDRTTFDEKIEKEKLHDWEHSGVDYKDFFSLSMNLLPDLLKVYRQTSQSISEVANVAIREELTKSGLLNTTEKEKSE